MFRRLKEKWKVNTIQLVLVIATFAIGGSLTGYVSRKLLQPFHLSPYWIWLLVFIVVVTLLWPLAVLLVSIPFGQFPFFLKYIGKIGRRVGIGKPANRTGKTFSKPVYQLAIFASGAGSNAQKIIDHFKNHPAVRIALIVTNNEKAGIVKIAKKEQIPVVFLEKTAFFDQNQLKNKLSDFRINWIILAGFLWKIPPFLIQSFPKKILNIHPALLPKYGGKGMYGNHVHEAVLASQDTESGISIHYVDELYDHGPVIFQARCPVEPGDTVETLARRIHELEHRYYPAIIEKTLGI